MYAGLVPGWVRAAVMRVPGVEAVGVMVMFEPRRTPDCRTSSPTALTVVGREVTMTVVEPFPHLRE